MSDTHTPTIVYLTDQEQAVVDNLIREIDSILRSNKEVYFRSVESITLSQDKVWGVVMYRYRSMGWVVYTTWHPETGKWIVLIHSPYVVPRL